MARQSYEQWLQIINDALNAQFLFDTEDLEDWDWHDAYEDGLSPREALALGLKNSGYRA